MAPPGRRRLAGKGESQGGTEANAAEDRTRRALNRDRVSRALDGAGRVAGLDRTERFTALFHHLDPDLLRPPSLAQNTEASPGVGGVT